MTEPERKVVPRGELVSLSVEQLTPSVANPRQLFDEEPLEALKASIREHGVLVPLTVYKKAGSDRFGIVDGERRYICCRELAEAGHKVEIPANVVAAPDAMASLIYMFNIHSFREQWELMPTAVGLQRIIEHLGGRPSDDELRALTGLSEPQIRRCRIILTYPERFQRLSLDANRKTRIPSNFWIELFPVLEIAERETPDLVEQLGRDGIIDRLVEKYRARRIKSVVHFRRILEAFDSATDLDEKQSVADRLREYILTQNLETRAAFDEFIVDSRRKAKVAEACERFVRELARARIDYVVEEEDRIELVRNLQSVRAAIDALFERLGTPEPPPPPDDEN
jgi:ParB/RepB/Spo0J family partition protein